MLFLGKQVRSELYPTPPQGPHVSTPSPEPGAHCCPHWGRQKLGEELPPSSLSPEGSAPAVWFAGATGPVTGYGPRVERQCAQGKGQGGKTEARGRKGKDSVCEVRLSPMAGTHVPQCRVSCDWAAVVGLAVMGRAIVGHAVVGHAVVACGVMGRGVVGCAVVGCGVLGRAVVGCDVVGLLSWAVLSWAGPSFLTYVGGQSVQHTGRQPRQLSASPAA